MGHVANWYVGWGMLLAAFVTGAGLGWFFGREDFMGGYGSWRRRLARLGHIALAALGMLNLIYGVAALPVAGSWQATGAGVGLMVGGITMPLCCFLAAWKKELRHGFVVPVAALIGAVVCALLG